MDVLHLEITTVPDEIPVLDLVDVVDVAVGMMIDVVEVECMEDDAYNDVDGYQYYVYSFLNGIIQGHADKTKTLA